MTIGELNSKDFSLSAVRPEGTEACNDRSFADCRQDKKDRNYWIGLKVARQTLARETFKPDICDIRLSLVSCACSLNSSSTRVAIAPEILHALFD
jgi:hypothetical protein